jgi:hypothetical protein
MKQLNERYKINIPKIKTYAAGSFSTFGSCEKLFNYEYGHFIHLNSNEV